MKNLEQIRAKNAIAFCEQIKDAENLAGDQGGNVVSGLPALIINNGLFASISFAVDKKKGHAKLLWEIARFLCDKDGANILSIPEIQAGSDEERLKIFVGELAKQDSGVLRRATTEALAYAGYLKRFARPKE